MNVIMENSLNELLNKEQKFRDSKNYIECLRICTEILKIILNYQEENIFEIISKILHHKNQSNFVRIGIIFHLIHRNYININNNDDLRGKFYKLLIDSLKKDSINDRANEKIDIIKYYDYSSKSKNFDKLDTYILTLDSIFLNEKSNSVEKDIFNNFSQHKSLANTNGENIIENNDLDEDLIPDESRQNQITQIGYIEELNNKPFELISSVNQNGSINKLTNNEKNLMKKYKPNNKLPMIMISVSVNLNSNGFMDLIGKTFAKLNYKNICTIKSNLHDNINIYEYNPKNIFEGIIYCLSKKTAFIKNVFQVITILKKDENNFSSGINYYLNDNYERKISIKTVRGREKNVINFILKFLKLFSASVNKIKLIKQSKCFFKYNLEDMLNDQIKAKKDSLLKGINFPKKTVKPEEDETIVEKSNKKANQYYDIYKTLSNTEYDLGKMVNNFIENFKTKCNEITSPSSEEKIEDINTKQMMVEIIKNMELSTNILNCNFNNTNNYNSNFFSTASEQFIFNKIYYYLYNIYNKKYQKENEEYLSIKKAINESMSIKEIMNCAGIKDKFKGNEELPYKNVIENINKISYEKYIKNKFKILTQSSLEMRSEIIDYTSGKEELVSMDDEIPIIIYIITQIKVENIFAELNMVDDYVKCTMRDDLVQNKMVTNLLSGLFYICKNWDEKLKTFK